MTAICDRDVAVEALKRALPYIRLYRGRTFVLKAGGALCGDAPGLKDLAEQVGVLRELGIRVAVVHGGGPQTTAMSRALGMEPTFVDGRRVTDEKTLDVAVMTLAGSANMAVLAACRAAGVPAIGLSGVDAAVVRAVRRPPRDVERDGRKVTVDFGRVGDVVSVDPGPLQLLLDAGIVPVVCPLAADDSGQVLNVNADTVASAVARALAAEKLVFLTDTAGLLEDPADGSSLVSYVDVAGVERLRAKGAIDGGMGPKVAAAIEALRGGVGRVHMVGWRSRSSLLVEVFTNEGSGTLLVRDTAEMLPAEVSGQ
jgi:acetylglutamate kinase